MNSGFCKVLILFYSKRSLIREETFNKGKKTILNYMSLCMKNSIKMQFDGKQEHANFCSNLESYKGFGMSLFIHDDSSIWNHVS